MHTRVFFGGLTLLVHRVFFLGGRGFVGVFFGGGEGESPCEDQTLFNKKILALLVYI